MFCSPDLVLGTRREAAQLAVEDLAERIMHPSETGYFQVAEADRLQKIESERRWKQIVEHIPDERLVGELGRRGYRGEAPAKPYPLRRMLTVRFQVKDGQFEEVRPMSEEDRICIVGEMREEATRRGRSKRRRSFNRC